MRHAISRKAARRAALLATGLWLLGCSSQEKQAGELDPFDLERMIRQAKVLPYAETDLFADGRAMRRPPEGTVENDRRVGDPALTRGRVGDAYVERIPVPVTLGLLRVGRTRFETFCAPCHGVAGDGESVVAENMTLRPPPSLVDARIQGFLPGRVYQVIVEGYGLMRSYEGNIALLDRWAIVAYLKVLGASRTVTLGALPPHLRERAVKELR